jgi:tetratricopeptide (TPR) repeat protein
MAPEQLRGEPLDGRADQFAWATLAIELLTGHHPWASGRNLPEAIAAIVSGAEPTLKKGALPNEVEATLRRALHNDPTLRFGTLRDAIAALQCVAGEARVAGQRLPAVETVPHADNTPAAVTRSVLPPQLRREHRAWLARTASSRHWPWLAGALAAIAIAAIVNFSPAAPLRIPEAGLAALSLYEDPKGSDAQALQSAALWQAAANDFGDAVRQPKAPLRWRAAQALSRGQYLSIKNQNEEGVAQLQRAVNLDPRWALPHLALSQALSRKGDVDGAANEAAEAERLLPKSWRGPYAAGMANSYAGHLAQAVDDFRRALVLAPDHPLVLSDLSLVYHAMRLDNEAAGVSRRALQLDPDVVAPHIVLAEVALECGDSEAAYNHATRALSVFPRSIPAQLAHAEALALSRRLPAATVVVEDVRQALAKQGPGPFQERLNAAEDTLLRTFEQFAADSEQPSLPAPSKPKVTFNVETGVFELDPELGKDRARSRVSRNNVILIERHARSAYPRRRIPLLARSRVDSFRATGSGEHRAAGAGAAARAADRAPAVAAPAPGARRPEPAPKDNLLLRLVRALVSTAKDDLATDGPRDKQPKR